MTTFEIVQMIGQICAIIAVFIGVVLAYVLNRFGKKQDTQDAKITALETAQSKTNNQLSQLIVRFDERTKSIQKYLNGYVAILKQTEKKVESQTERLHEIKGQLDTMFLLKKIDRRSGGDRRRHNYYLKEEEGENENEH